jgi:hypothetical protein
MCSIYFCFLIHPSQLDRAKIFLQCERPALALEDMKEVFAEAPDDFRAHCTYVSQSI